jgi:Uma2 family endonuclease
MRPMLVLDPGEQRLLIERRRDSGAERYDEVWDGTYVVMPTGDNDHQAIRGELGFIFELIVGQFDLGHVRFGVNVSDREIDWEENYRCPDNVVFLKGTTARNLDTHWVGGPDFTVDVISRNDRSREKLDFYAEVGTREVLLVDRFPWALELYRLRDGALVLVGKSTADRPEVLVSEVLPLTFRLVAADPRPRIEVVHVDGVQRWSA